MKAEKKPVTIDYFDGHGLFIDYEIQDWMDEFNEKFTDHFEILDAKLFVKTLEGTSYELVSGRDIIIRGIKGEYYPCRKDIFIETYNKLN